MKKKKAKENAAKKRCNKSKQSNARKTPVNPDLPSESESQGSASKEGI